MGARPLFSSAASLLPLCLQNHGQQQQESEKLLGGWGTRGAAGVFSALYSGALRSHGGGGRGRPVDARSITLRF